MSELYERRVELEVVAGGISRKWQGLDVAFSVDQTAGSEPNRAEILVYNLSEDSRRMVSDAGAVVRLRAGYPSTIALLFQGDIDEASSEREGPDVVTRIVGADGGAAIRRTVVSVARAEDTPVDTVIGDILAALGLDRGSVATVSGTFKQGLSVVGKAADLLDEVCASQGQRWSVQDGAVQIHPAGSATPAPVIVLSPESGLVGVPRRQVDRAAGDAVVRRGVQLRSLLQPEIRPGRRIRVVSDWVPGDFVVEKVRHVGSVFGPDFYSEIEAY